MFTDRLNMLFEGSPRFGGPVTQAAVVDTLTGDGYHISRPYMSQLCRGTRTNPSTDIVAALADAFGVDGEFFYLPVDDSCGSGTAGVIEGLQQAPLRRLLKSVDDLSQPSTARIVEMAERLRRLERRPSITAGEY